VTLGGQIDLPDRHAQSHWSHPPGRLLPDVTSQKTCLPCGPADAGSKPCPIGLRDSAAGKANLSKRGSRPRSVTGRLEEDFRDSISRPDQIVCV
jgi:hypothetical protein